MGLAGYKMEDSDTFMDVKASYRDFLEDGMTPSEATKAVCEEYEEALEDEDDAVFIWAALADAQRDAGKPLVSTKKKCLTALEQEIVRLDAGEVEPKDPIAYRAMITDFRKEIEEGKKKPKKRRAPVKCDWKPGGCICDLTARRTGKSLRH